MVDYQSDAEMASMCGVGSITWSNTTALLSTEHNHAPPTTPPTSGNKPAAIMGASKSYHALSASQAFMNKLPKSKVTLEEPAKSAFMLHPGAGVATTTTAAVTAAAAVAAASSSAESEHNNSSQEDTTTTLASGIVIGGSGDDACNEEPCGMDTDDQPVLADATATAEPVIAQSMQQRQSQLLPGLTSADLQRLRVELRKRISAEEARKIIKDPVYIELRKHCDNAMRTYVAKLDCAGFRVLRPSTRLASARLTITPIPAERGTCKFNLCKNQRPIDTKLHIVVPYGKHYEALMCNTCAHAYCDLWIVQCPEAALERDDGVGAVVTAVKRAEQLI